ncbi:MAG: hypothetical protein BGN88_09835 [Clostridiales bacterium 43-6]|nr:MAG: hypothetical protein BGN88_09835 [Clostridiales bacterium 43-6]
MKNMIRKIIAETEDLSFDAYSIGEDIDISELGLDSIQIIEIIVKLEKEFNLNISIDITLEDGFTIRRISEEISSKMKNG